jgi:hypothetical protein
MLPDYDRAAVIGEYWANPKTRTFAELLIEPRRIGTCAPWSWGCFEGRTARAVPSGKGPRPVLLSSSWI